MSDRRFFPLAGPFSLAELSDIADGEPGPGADPEERYTDVAALSVATQDHISFLDNKRYISAFEESQAGACVVHPKLASKAPAGMALVLSERPYHAYAKIARAFHPAIPVSPGIHPSATVGENCRIKPGVQIDAGVRVGDNVEIGKGSVIRANTVIEHNVVIGADCTIGANVTLQFCLLGDRVVLHPGVRVGQDGFGFAMGHGDHEKVPQLGRVVVENDVEVGANTTIDRGAGPDTVIGAGSKIDNLVQLGHNVKVGKGCIIVSQVGISGSTEIGDSTVIGGQTGIAGHLTIGSGVQIAAKSGVMRNIDNGLVVGGSPAQPMKDWLRSVAAVERMGRKRRQKT